MAVLPFANLNAGPENDYLCDGLTEELIHSLTKVRELRVVAWNSAARAKRGREQDLEAIRWASNWASKPFCAAAFVP